MKIIVASDSFKGSLTSLQVAQAAEKGILDVFPSCDVLKVAVADGGEGTVDAMGQMVDGRMVKVLVEDPVGRQIGASYVILEESMTAVLEMSAASGLTLLSPEERNPWITSTFGTGQMIADALSRGCRKFLIGIGGSATNDAGMGMLKALGYRFLDSDGEDLPGIGASMAKVSVIDDSNVMQSVLDSEFIVACDVNSPFYGPEGAALVFAPQKGAGQNMASELDEGLRHFSRITAQHTGVDVSLIKGTGAAGGLGGAFVAYLGARIERGVETVLDAIGFDQLIADADLIITGEGKIDDQTFAGKTPYGVLQRASEQGIPVIAIGGCVELEADVVFNAGFYTVVSVTPAGMSYNDAMDSEIASHNIAQTVKQLLIAWKEEAV